MPFTANLVFINFTDYNPTKLPAIAFERIIMKEPCILCGRIIEPLKIEGKSEYSVECLTCGNYSYDHFFKSSYSSMDNEKRAMISAFTRENYELGKDPLKLGDPDHLEDKIIRYKDKSIKEKIDNLLLYLKRKSSFLGDNISWDAKKDYPITFSPNPQEFVKIRDSACSRGFLLLKSRGAGLQLSDLGWEKVTKLEKDHEMNIKEKRDRFLLRASKMAAGDIHKDIETMKVSEGLGFDRSMSFSFVMYFEQKRLLKLRTDAGDVFSITALGIDHADRIQHEISQPLFSRNGAFGNDVFIVHGHDVEAKETVARYIEKLGIKAIILHEIPNIGRTIIEKFEDHSNVGFAVVLLTPDDLGFSKDKKNIIKPRARQNVIFELGYFMGKLGRKRVCVLYKENVEIPTDYEGILYIKLDNTGEWKQSLIREMKAIGLEINDRSK